MVVPCTQTVTVPLFISCGVSTSLCVCVCAAVYDLLKENLMTRDDAVIGEAAGLAMGLVMVGSHSVTAIEDMTNVS